MSNADDIFWRRFGMILAILTLFGFVVAFLARNIAGDAHQVSMNNPAAVAARIAPMGEARVGDPAKTVAATPEASPAPAATVAAAPASAAAAVDGEQVYNSSCMACHATGAANAPKKGDDAAWAARIALGEDALVASVVNGKGAMPPKAGNPTLSEEQIRAAVQYLIGAGDTGGSAKAEDTVAAATGAVKEAASSATAAAQAAATEVVDKAKSMAADAANQVTGATGQAAGDSASATSAMASTATTAAAGSTVVAAAPSADSAGKPGNEVYNLGCLACHATGAANAPKLTDKAAWETRAATGMSALMQSVTKGKGAMPPRGGLSTLSDADINNAILYMLKEAGVEAGS